MKEYSDLELINMVRNGDNSAFGIIVEKHEARIASTVKGMLGNTQEADDVGQEVFIRFYKSINNFRGEAKLSTYLTRIAINLSLNEIKKRKAKKFLSFESWSEAASILPDSGNKSIDFEKTEVITKALEKLDTKFKSVVVLRLIDGYSTEETAEILGIPSGTVLSRLSRAQKKLKNLLTPYMEGI